MKLLSKNHYENTRKIFSYGNMENFGAEGETQRGGGQSADLSNLSDKDIQKLLKGSIDSVGKTSSKGSESPAEIKPEDKSKINAARKIIKEMAKNGDLPPDATKNINNLKEHRNDIVKALGAQGYDGASGEATNFKAGQKLSEDQTRKVAESAGFQGGDVDMAVKIAKAESSFDSKATNKNKNGTTDKGLMQINDVHKAKIKGDIFDPQENMRVAKTIKESGEGKGGWKQWSTYDKVAGGGKGGKESQSA